MKSHEDVIWIAFYNFGFRVENLFITLFVAERGNDFEEMLLHDLVTFFLFFGCIFSNMVPLGACVTFIHDASDILARLSRLLHVSTLNRWALPSYILFQVKFVYLRFFCFISIIVELIWTEFPTERMHFNPFISITSIFLCKLLVLHIVWFGLCQRLNYSIYLKHKNSSSAPSA